MNWLFLAIAIACILLACVVLAACRRESPSPPRKTRLYDHDVSQIVVFGSDGDQYHFIFTRDQTAGVMRRALAYEADDEFDFDGCSLCTVSRGLALYLRNVESRQGKINLRAK